MTHLFHIIVMCGFVPFPSFDFNTISKPFNTKKEVDELVPLERGETVILKNKKLGDVEYRLGKIVRNGNGFLHIISQGCWQRFNNGRKDIC